MHTKIIIRSLILIFLCAAKTYGQEVLTIKDAMSIALKNNFDIKIASNNLDIDKTNSSLGNAGILPRVNATLVDGNNIQNSTLVRQDGTVNTLNNAINNNLNYGVLLDWTIFDGFKMFARREQLSELQKLGEARLKRTIIMKISEVNAVYYDLVQQQQQLAALDSTIVISTKRLELAENRFKIGKASKLEVLNAQVDLNTDKVMLLRQKESYSNLKTALNQVLSRDASIDFKVVDEVQVNNKLVLKELMDLAEKQNPQLEAEIINKRVAELQLKQIKGERYPLVTVNSGYSIFESVTSLGFASSFKGSGFTYGLRASLNLFNGMGQNRNEKIAKIQLENSKIAIEQQSLLLQSELTIAFQTYLTNLELIQLEETNEAIAKQNLSITIEKFRIGTITTIEFRAAQLNYINAKVRFSNSQFQAKLSEIALRELAGNMSF
jgi:outer membrane protein TolC